MSSNPKRTFLQPTPLDCVLHQCFHNWPLPSGRPGSSNHDAENHDADDHSPPVFSSPSGSRNAWLSALATGGPTTFDYYHDGDQRRRKARNPNAVHPSINAAPPIGVTQLIRVTPVSASTNRLPLNNRIPIQKLHPATTAAPRLCSR